MRSAAGDICAADRITKNRAGFTSFRAVSAVPCEPCETSAFARSTSAVGVEPRTSRPGGALCSRAAGLEGEADRGRARNHRGRAGARRRGGLRAHEPLRAAHADAGAVRDLPRGAGRRRARACRPTCAAALDHRGPRDPRVPRDAGPGRHRPRDRRCLFVQPGRAAAPGRRVCAGRHRGLPVVGVDGRDPGQGRRRAGGDPGDAAGARRGAAGGRDRRRSTGCSRSAGRRRSPRWRWGRRRCPGSTRSSARQRLRHRGQAPGVRAASDRRDRRAERDRGRRRRDRRPRAGRRRPHRPVPSTTCWPARSSSPTASRWCPQ